MTVQEIIQGDIEVVEIGLPGLQGPEGPQGPPGDGGSGGVTDGDKGDIVVSASGSIWMLDSGVVSPYGRSLIAAADAAAARTTLNAAQTVHTHAIADVSGLQTAIDGKQPLDAELTALAASSAFFLTLADDVDAAAARATLGAAATVHAHVTADITGLDAALAAKADDTDLALYALLAGAAFTGAVTMPSATVDAGIFRVDRTGDGVDGSIVIRADAGKNRDYVFSTGTSNRWILRADTAAEGGSNAGSNFALRAFDDAGSSIGEAFTVARATRVVDFPVSPTVPTPAAADSSTKAATTAFVQGELAAKETVGKRVGINTQTASYTLVAADTGKLVEYNSASAGNLTIPPNSSVAFPLNTWIDLSQYGAGQLSVVAGAGVTIRSAGGALKLRAQYSGASLLKRGTDEWYLFGDITT